MLLPSAGAEQAAGAKGALNGHLTCQKTLLSQQQLESTSNWSASLGGVAQSTDPVRSCPVLSVTTLWFPLGCSGAQAP